jgi:hypothetical protein
VERLLSFFFFKTKKKERKENHIDLFCFPLLKSAAESGRKEGGWKSKKKKQEFSLYFAVVPLFFPSPFCSLVVFFFFWVTERWFGKQLGRLLLADIHFIH